MRVLNAIDTIVSIFWLGGLWVIGYVVAPVLFHMLPREQAGLVAGQLFAVIGYVGLAAAAWLLVSEARQGAAFWRSRRTWILLAMLCFIAIGMFVLQPIMTDLKAQGLVAGSDTARRFGMLHGVSSVLYLITSLLGLAYAIMRGPRV